MDSREHPGDLVGPGLEHVEVLAEQLDDELGPGAGNELVDAAGDGLAEGKGHAGEVGHGQAHPVGQLFTRFGRGPLRAGPEHAHVARLFDPSRFQCDPRLAGLADDRDQLGELFHAGLDFAAHLQGIRQRHARQELEVHVESPLVHDGHEFRAQAWQEKKRAGEEDGGRGEEDGLVPQAPSQQGEVNPSGGVDEEDLLLPVRLEHQVTESGDGEKREEERTEEGDDVSEGQRQEHLALDPLQGDDGNEGQGDDELAEDAGLAHFEHGPQDDRQLAGTRHGLAQMALDVLHLDDGGVDDHADGDGQSAEGHEIGR